MKKYRWQILTVLVTALIVGFLIYFQQTSPVKKLEATPAPVSGGIFTEGLVGNFARLNPLLAFYSQADRDVNSLIYSSLIKFNSNGTAEGDLAETWEVSADATRYTVKLRPGVNWHDGVPFTSQDVSYTVSLLQSNSDLLPPDLREFWPLIQVLIPNDFTVEFSLPEPFAPFLDYLNFKILPQHLLGNLTLEALADHPFNLAPVGTGPYRFDKLTVTDGVITEVHLKPYELWYGGKAFLNEFIFKYYPSDSAALAAYVAGEVDSVSVVSQASLPAALAQKDLNLYSAPEPRVSIVFFNLANENKPFFKQAEFRQALFRAINRQGIIDQQLSGQAIFANGPIIPTNWAYYPDLPSYQYDPDAARQAIARMGIIRDESGYMVTPEGAQVSFFLLTEDDEIHRSVAEKIKADWGVLGVAVEVQVMPAVQLKEALKTHNYDAALVDINLSGTPDPDPYPFWGQAMIQNGQNYSAWDNRTASEFLEQARVTSDQSVRQKFYRNFQIYFQDECPALPLYYSVYNYAVRNTIHDVTFGPMNDQSDRFNNVARWYILANKTNQTTPAAGN